MIKITAYTDELDMPQVRVAIMKTWGLDVLLSKDVEIELKDFPIERNLDDCLVRFKIEDGNRVKWQSYGELC